MATRIPTQAEYEANELKMLFAEYRQTERQSLADKRAGASEAFAIMRDAPQVIGDRMNLIFNGDFGAGAQIHARRIISQPMRPARLMELLTLVCVLEFRCPPDATLQAWNKLDHGQQRKVNDALSAQIRVAEKSMADEARRNPVELAENLDAFNDSEDLNRHISDVVTAGKYPQAYVNYAKFKARAIDCRKMGLIEEARQNERGADAEYKKIPAAWRW